MTDQFLLISGPCQIESLDHALVMAEALQKLAEKYSFELVYKSSFDKANRSKLESARGVGIEEGLAILAQVKQQIGCRVLTDIHLPEQAAEAAESVDLLQIPAFLCRQTDLLLAAGRTGKPVNVKKGQFLHPEDMRFAAEKITSAGTKSVFLCERGTTFGYRDLVVDMRSLVQMRALGFPVIFDATHSVQMMGGSSGTSGGNPQFIGALSRAAVAVGIDGIFIECHEEPRSAPSDAASMLELEKMDPLLQQLSRIQQALK